MKRAKNLFEPLISDENLSRAIDEVNRTHHWRTHHRPNKCTAWVEETKEERIKELRQIIIDGFEQKPPHTTRRWDASAQKWRTVSEPAQWPDQYVHHALIQILQPIFMRGMDHYCCGSIRDRGPHQARAAIESWMNHDMKGTRYELCGDVRHFYDSLKPEVVMDRMRRLIKDRRVLDLIWRIVKDGVRIGSYTSQWFANTVLQPLDQMIRNSGLCAHYVRYMDNLTVFGPNKRKLKKLRLLVEKWLTEHQLELKGDWQIFPIARYRKRKRQGKRIMAGAAASLISRLGQLKHCNNYNLYRLLYKGERLVRDLKRIIRQKQRKEELTWSMYLERRKTSKSSRQRAVSIPI